MSSGIPSTESSRVPPTDSSLTVSFAPHEGALPVDNVSSVAKQALSPSSQELSVSLKGAYVSPSPVPGEKDIHLKILLPSGRFYYPPLTDDQQKKLVAAYLKCTNDRLDAEIDLAELKLSFQKEGKREDHYLHDGVDGIKNLKTICAEILKKGPSSFPRYTKLSRGNENGDPSLHDKTARLHGLKYDAAEWKKDLQTLSPDAQKKATQKQQAARAFMHAWIKKLKEQKKICENDQKAALAETRAALGSRIERIESVLSELEHLLTHRFAIDFALAHPLQGEKIQELAQNVKKLEAKALEQIKKQERPLNTYGEGYWGKIRTVFAQVTRSRENADPEAEQAYARDVALLGIPDRHTYELVRKELGMPQSKKDSLEWAIYHMAEALVETDTPSPDRMKADPIQRLLSQLHCEDQRIVEDVLKEFALPKEPEAPSPAQERADAAIRTAAPLPSVSSVAPIAKSIVPPKPKKMVRVLADGNCFYYSALVGLTKLGLKTLTLQTPVQENGVEKLTLTEGAKKAAATLRQEVVDWLTKNKNDPVTKAQIDGSIASYQEDKLALLNNEEVTYNALLNENPKNQLVQGLFTDLQAQKAKLQALTPEEYLKLAAGDQFFCSAAESYALCHIYKIAIQITGAQPQSIDPFGLNNPQRTITMRHSGNHFDAEVDAQPLKNQTYI